MRCSFALFILSIIHSLDVLVASNANQEKDVQSNVLSDNWSGAHVLVIII